MIAGPDAFAEDRAPPLSCPAPSRHAIVVAAVEIVSAASAVMSARPRLRLLHATSLTSPQRVVATGFERSPRFLRPIRPLHVDSLDHTAVAEPDEEPRIARARIAARGTHPPPRDGAAGSPDTDPGVEHVAVAKRLRLGEIEQTTIRVGAYLHDVGKVKVPHEVLNKPGKLTDEEFALMQQHTIYGVELLAAIEFPWDIRPIIRWHHERADGRGYPDALQGEEIPLHAQIIGIVDVWDALTTDRPYRKAMTSDEAMAQMEQCRGWWRPEVYEAFAKGVASRDIGTA